MTALGLAWRNLRWRAISTWLAILSVGLGVALVAGLRSIPPALRGSVVEPAAKVPVVVGLGESASRLVLGAVFLEPPALPDLPLDAVARVKSAAGVLEAIPLRVEASVIGPLVYTTRGYFQFTTGRLRLAGGRFFSEQGADEAVIGSALASEHALGGSLERRGRRLTVVGVLAPAGGLLDQAVFVALPEGKPPSAVLVAPGEGFAPQGLQRALPGAQVALVEETLQRVSRLLGALDEIVAWLSGALTLLVVVLVLSSFYSGVRERTRDLAILRAIGARRGTLVTILGIEASVIGGAGAALGLLASELLIQLAWVALNRARYAFAPQLGQEGLRVGALGLLATVVAGLLPALSVYRIDPVRSLAGIHRPWREVLGRRGRTILTWLKMTVVLVVIGIVPGATFRPSPPSRPLSPESLQLFARFEGWDGQGSPPAEIAQLEGKELEVEGYQYVPVEPLRPAWRSSFFLVAEDPNKPVEPFHDDAEHQPEANQRIRVELKEPVEATLYPVRVKGTFVITHEHAARGEELYRLENAEARVIALERD